MKGSILILLSSFFLFSCGNGEHQEDATEDTTNMITAPIPAEEVAPAVPDTVKGIDSTVKLKENTSGINKKDAGIGGN